MAELFKRVIRNGDNEYRVITELNEADMMHALLHLSIKGAVRSLPDGDWIEVTLDLKVNFQKNIVEISTDDIIIAKVPLNLPLKDVGDPIGNGIDIIANSRIIEGAIGKAGVEKIIHLIPTDPFLGCLIKGAVSTAVGQIIYCWKKTHQPDVTIGQRVREIGGCLREHALRMALTFMYRAGRCTLTGGSV